MAIDGDDRIVSSLKEVFVTLAVEDRRHSLRGLIVGETGIGQEQSEKLGIFPRAVDTRVIQAFVG
jgi:hypothetical protein